MILIYAPKATNRLKYTAAVLFGDLLGVSSRVSSNEKEFLNHSGPRLTYGVAPLSDKELFIESSGLLMEQGIRDLNPAVLQHEGLPLLFPMTAERAALPFDVFSAVFFLLSRYEEYLPYRRDRFGRFEATESMAFRHGFLDIPVVDHYALLLRDEVLKIFPEAVFPERRFEFVPTYDIDVAFAYKGRGVFRTLLGSLRSIVSADWKGLKQRFMVLTGKENDPYDTYDYQLDLHRQYNIKPYYFFLCADYGHLDKNLAFFSPVFFRLVKKISDYAHVGIHPSAASFSEPGLIKKETSRLNQLLNRSIRHSRQHYLMMRFPDTYRELIRNNILADFTMGYASRTGFRAGTCTPFHFYDLDRESATQLKIFPFAVMDGTLKDYMKLSPDEAIRHLAMILDHVKQVNGTCISLWHNESLCECKEWAGWRRVYESLFLSSFGTNQYI